ncbi:NAD(P) transhydrogenase subunit alpha [Zhouia spongiae]|uniref:proton-translocating NAD(P)(+) transhydrogenase n=1 Tax=Zhouia spongiae TaxID=2202721 RepID=A0ABY3YKC4_9FLAO|nr:NAD(P) transhydrogenase subunit alpha [Zhouia spongiae]UNY98277.1 NAD(P) transhydrogenase subunit alpha [Zhouia spongiae]
MNQFFITDIDGIYVVIFSLFIGIEVIKNVPAIIHTPLMSGANAISGIILLGAIIQLMRVNPDDYMQILAAALAIVLATINITGGFFVTHRMLTMFTTAKNK